MIANRWMRVLVVALFLALPSRAGAQEAVLSGVVTDSTGGVMPGVVITAVHVASGNTFTSVTDERGEYRLPARTGDYRITAALDGFGAVTQQVELLVGQVVRTTFELVPSALQETITVSGEPPILDTTQSSLSGNIDRRQMESLPVNGRNWLGLALLAPGSRATQVNDTPYGSSGFNDAGMFQILLDGQEITQTISFSTSAGQPRISRDAIQEFEFKSNRFDAEYGRSGGVIVSAVTKSGTNAFAGTLSGYFRSDTFNAADFVAKKVLPYSNQQIAGTFGGPIRQDRAHFFGFYEYEREPKTWVYSTPYPAFNLEYSGTQGVRSGGGRFDLQFSSAMRLMVRGSFSRQNFPINPGFAFTQYYPTWGGNAEKRNSQQVYGTLTHILNARTVNEVAGGYHYYEDRFGPAFSGGEGAPDIRFRTFRIGKITTSPRNLSQEMLTIRDNFTTHRSKGGTHDLKVGGEFIAATNAADPQCYTCDGFLFVDRGPEPANIQELFPSMDRSTWNLAALSPLTSRYQVAIGEFEWQIRRKTGAFWVQDDWKPVEALTLNLGMRSDYCYGCFVDDLEFPPLTVQATRTVQHWTVSPRLGVVYALPNDRTVIRGGGGLFYLAQTEHVGIAAATNAGTFAVDIPNDGRPDFAANPWNGPTPTFEELLVSGRPRSYAYRVPGPDARVPYMWQGSVGFQHELANGLAVQADYLRAEGRALPVLLQANLTCNPATGFNYPYSDVSKRPYPEYGVLPYIFWEGWSESNALQTAVTKRFSRGWQLQGTYTLSKGYDNAFLNGIGEVNDNPCNWQESEWSESLGENRHRVVLNGVWSLPAGFELSGLYFYGSGERYATAFGGDRRVVGNVTQSRLRPDGTIVPRNDFVGTPLHRVDLRVTKRFALGGGIRVDGMLEMFNVFNHANYSYGNAAILGYTTQENVPPVQSSDVAYLPRMLQLGFRVAF